MADYATPGDIPKPPVKYIILGVILVGLLLFAGKMFKNIEAGHAGVLFETLSGGVDISKTYGEGLHFKLPWNDIVEFEVRQQELKEEMSVLSSNGLDIKVSLSGWIQPVYEELPSLYQEKGKDYIAQVVQPSIGSATRSVIGRYTPEEIYSTKRDAIEIEIEEETKRILQAQHVRVNEILVRDITLPAKIKEAIENKLEQEQESLEYKFRIEKAEKEAERKKIEAEGIQEFQNIVNQSITPQLLKWKGVEATEGLAKSNNAKVVVIGGGDGGLPIILNAE